MKSNRITLRILLLLALISQACGQEDKKDVQTQELNSDVVSLTQAQYEHAGIKSDSMTTRPMSYTIKVSGKIDVPPQNMVSISAPMGGFLKSTKLLPGMHLNKGEVIATMEDQQYIQLQHDYLTAGYELEYLEKEYERQKELLASKAVSEKSFEQIRSTYKMKLTDRKSLAEKLKLIGIHPEGLTENSISSTIKLYSPIDGYVSQVKVNIGKYIQASEVMFELVNPEDIHLNLTIFEKDLPYLSIGQMVKAYNNSVPERIYPCEIILIGQDVSIDRHVEVHCHFEKYDRSLIPGMYMNGEIQTQTQSVRVIANSAIISHQGEKYVFYKEGGLNYRMRRVETGMQDKDKTEIVNYEHLLGKEIITHGAYDLLMALKNVEEEE